MPALELRPILGWLNDSTKAPLSRPAGSGLLAKSLWQPAETGDHLQIEIYAVEPGGHIAPRYHDGFPAMLICWQGEGTMTIAESAGRPREWNQPYATVSIGQYDSVFVPPGALYRIDSAVPQSSARLVLLAVHPLQDRTFNESDGVLGTPGAAAYPWIRHLAPDRVVPPGETPVYTWDPNEEHRATRNRIWGKDGVLADGMADPAKQHFHLVAYCFNAHQENPPHFHPRSVEFMLGLLGDALTYTRSKRPKDNGWDPTINEKTIAPGDTALVGLADIHRYINTTDKRAIVLALQTPQPIMHTLEHEVRLFKSLEAET